VCEREIPTAVAEFLPTGDMNGIPLPSIEQTQIVYVYAICTGFGRKFQTQIGKSLA
jgi:hypothetical protein